MKRLERFHDDFNEALELLRASKELDEEERKRAMFSTIFGMLTGIAENLAILVDRLEEEKENKEGAEDY